MPTKDNARRVPYQLIVIFVILAVGFGTAGYLYYENQKQETRLHAENALQVFADWKANQISRLYEGLYSDAVLFIENPFVFPGVKHWMETPDDLEAQGKILAWLDSIRKHYLAQCAALVDEDGAIRLSAPPGAECYGDMFNRFPEAMNSTEPAFTDLYRSQGQGDLHFDFAIPLASPDGGHEERCGFLLLWLDPNRFLYPLVQSTFNQGGTTETVLVRREGREVVYLNELRFRKDTALSLRFPLDSPLLPAAMAARGQEGIIEGLDYRGVPVLAAVRSIPRSPWFLVVKRDIEEIYAPLRTRAFVMYIFGCTLLVIAGTCLGLIWTRRETEYYRRQYEAETRRLESLQRYENLTKYANDIIITADTALKIIEANDRAIASYGFTRDELLQMTIGDLRTAAAPGDLKDQMRRAREENGLVFESVHRRKDGSSFPVEISVRPVKLGDRMVYLSICRDISEKKQAEEKILHFNRLYALLSQMNQMIVRTPDRGRLFEGVCRTAVEYGGLRMAWIGLPDNECTSANPAAHYGAEDGFLDELKALIEKSPEAGYVVKNVLREGKACVCKDLATDPQVSAWRDEALKRGYRSSVSLPLRVGQTVAGVLTLYASEPGFFDHDEVGLLEEVALDLSFALEKMEQEEERARAVGLLRQSERELSFRNRIADVLLTAPDQDMYGEVLSIIMRAFESERGVFSYYDDSGDIVATSMQRAANGEPLIEEDGLHLSRETWTESIWGGAAGRVEGSLSADLRSFPDGNTPLSPVLTVPVVFHDKTIGYLGIADEGKCYGESDGELLEKIADYIAPVLAARQEGNREEKERKLALQNFQESTNRFENLSRQFNALLDVIPDGLSLQSADLRIIWANKAASNWASGAGWAGIEEPASLIGQQCFRVRHNRTDPCEQCPVIESFGTAKPTGGYSSTPDGRAWELRSIPIIDGDGEVRSVVELARDVTENHRLQQQLQRAQKMEAIGALAGGIAHDFNNILGIIMGYTELALRNTPRYSKTWDQLQNAVKAAERAKDLVKQILAFTRGTGEKRQPIHLVPIIKEAFKLLSASLPSTIEIRQGLDVPWDEDAILADPTEIHQILINLCANAAHAMREGGGTLEVNLGMVHLGEEDPDKPVDLNPGDYIRLTVSDTGHGIDPGIVNRIFDPYFTTKQRGEGTGLGLSVVHGIVMSSGGAITVSGPTGAGTTFDVFFPKLAGAKTIEGRGLDLFPSGNERILLVDDEESLVDACRLMLEQLGYHVLAATGSVAALEAFQSDPLSFDLVVSDQTMPRMTGLELAREIIRIRPGMPIVLCTGFSEAVSEEVVESIGIRKVVMKPILMKDLAATVRQVIDECRRSE